MKHFLSYFILCFYSSFLLLSCAAKDDTDIQQKINDELKKDRAGAALNATVDNGIATITGECIDDSCSVRLAERIKKIKGVKEVQTHIIEKK